MRHGDDGDFVDGRQFTDRILHFGGIDVEAAGDNQVFFASYDRDISSLIDPAHVSRNEITLAKFGGGLFGHAPIAFEHIGAPYLDKPDLARRPEERRAGKESVSKSRSRGWRYHEQKKKT